MFTSKCWIDNIPHSQNCIHCSPQRDASLTPYDLVWRHKNVTRSNQHDSMHTQTTRRFIRFPFLNLLAMATQPTSAYNTMQQRCCVVRNTWHGEGWWWTKRGGKGSTISASGSNNARDDCPIWQWRRQATSLPLTRCLNEEAHCRSARWRSPTINDRFHVLTAGYCQRGLVTLLCWGQTVLSLSLTVFFIFNWVNSSIIS